MLPSEATSVSHYLKKLFNTASSFSLFDVYFYLSI